MAIVGLILQQGELALQQFTYGGNFSLPSPTPMMIAKVAQTSDTSEMFNIFTVVVFDPRKAYQLMKGNFTYWIINEREISARITT